MSLLMSLPVPLEELRPLLANADVAFLVSCAATALVFYEHIITIGVEVRQIWKRDISGATILFILTRYITLLDRIFVLVSLSSIHSINSCRVITWLQAVTTSVLIVVMAATAGVRVYALWNRDIRMFCIVLLSGMFPAFTNFFFRGASAAYIIPTNLYSCQSAPWAMSASLYKELSIATRLIAILSDGLVVVLTWLKTYRVFVLTRKLKFQTNFSTLLLRDGTIYFLAVCILNLVALAYIMNAGSNLMNDMIVTLSSMLMARFLLNLRDERSRGDILATSMSGSDRPMSSSIRFNTTLLDSMGGSVGMTDAMSTIDEHYDENVGAAFDNVTAQELERCRDNDKRDLKGILGMEEETMWV